MLTIFNSFKAIHNPCKTCRVRKDKQRYHDCMSFCHQSKSYLLAIGEIPHKPLQKNLNEIYPPPKQYHKLSLMCSREEYSAGCAKLRQIKDITNLSSMGISQLLNMSVNIVRSMLRRAERRTEITNINKIMGYQL